ncbi:hypothetical protein CF319_g6165 [Tilletia indica]|nr:hypothetical protein CF319_g6165 [Tilletia indica]
MSASNRLPLQPLKHASRASVTVAAAAASSDILGTSRSTSKPSWLCVIVKFPSLGLFTSSHMSYEIDRNSTLKRWSLLLSMTSMLLVRIDHAGHNDPAGHENDIIQYTSLFRAVTQWVDANHDALVEPSKM